MDSSPPAAPSWWRRRGYDLMRVQETALVWVEVLVGALLLAFGTLIVLYGGYDPGIPLVVVGYALVLTPAILNATVGSSQGYVVFLASKAAGSRLSGFDPSYFEYHVPAMRRLGGRLSGRFQNSAVFVRAPPPGHEGEPRPENVDEIMRAIQLRLVDAGAPLPEERRAEPFARYAADVADAFGRGDVTLEAWRSFLLRRYWAAPEGCRLRAKQYPLASAVARLLSWVNGHEKILMVLIALATFVVYLYSVFPKG